MKVAVRRVTVLPTFPEAAIEPGGRCGDAGKGNTVFGQR
jgi:hypothetical protein